MFYTNVDIVSIIESGRTSEVFFDKSIHAFYETLFYMGCVMKTPIISFLNGITGKISVVIL